MNSLTVSLGVHSPLTPELRDRILETTRARMEEPAYRLLSPEHLRGLARLEARDDPIISVYLCLTPERRAAGGWQDFSSNAWWAGDDEGSQRLQFRDRSAPARQGRPAGKRNAWR